MDSYNTDLEKRLDKLEDCIKLVCELKEPDRICDSQTSYEAIFYIYKILSDKSFQRENQNWDTLTDHGFENVIVNVIYHVSNIWPQIIGNPEMTAELAPNQTTSFDERCISILEYLVHIVFTLTNLQFKNETLFQFNVNLINNNIFEAFSLLYKYPKILKMKSYVKEFHDLLIEITCSIRNLSENQNCDKSMLKSIKIEQTLKELKQKHRYFQYMIDEISLNINQKSLYDSIKYLTTFKDMFRLIDNKYAYSELLFISKLVNKPLFKQQHLFIEFNCEKLFYNILFKLNQIKSELDLKKSKIEFYYPNKSASLNERRVSIFYYTLFIMNWLIYNSIKLNQYFNTLKMIKVLVSFLKDERFLARLYRYNLPILSAIIKNLTKFSRYSTESKKYWNQDSGLIEILLKIKRWCDGDKKDETRIEINKSICYCISFILNDYQIETLKESEGFLRDILKDLVDITSIIKSDRYIKRVEREHLLENDIIIQESTYEVGFLKTYNLSAILDSLRHYAINASTKRLIYKEIGSIKVIIEKGNYIEILYSLILMAHLCFDEEICRDLINNESIFIDYLTNDFYNSLSDDQTDLKSACENILFLLNQIEDSTETDNESNDSKNIMISYTWNNKNLCMSIKNELKKRGYTVHLDTSSVYSIKNVKRLIEKSFCVLLCVCERYRLNENCQLEAKYASKLGKKIVPLRTQDFDSIRGWLGEVVGEFKLVNFSNDKFDKSMQSLVKEIENSNSIKSNKSTVKSNIENSQLSSVFSPEESAGYIDYEIEESQINDEQQDHVDEDDEDEEYFSKNLNHNFSETPYAETKATERGSECDYWGPEQVKKWMSDNKIHPAIQSAFKKLNGQTLKELYYIKIENPKYFHQSLIQETNNKAKLSDVALFSSKLKLLFEKC